MRFSEMQRFLMEYIKIIPEYIYGFCFPGIRFFQRFLTSFCPRIIQGFSQRLVNYSFQRLFTNIPRKMSLWISGISPRNNPGSRLLGRKCRKAHFSNKRAFPKSIVRDYEQDFNARYNSFHAYRT